MLVCGLKMDLGNFLVMRELALPFVELQTIFVALFIYGDAKPVHRAGVDCEAHCFVGVPYLSVVGVRDMVLEQVMCVSMMYAVQLSKTCIIIKNS